MTVSTGPGCDLSLLLGQGLLPRSLHQCWSLPDPMVSRLRQWRQTQASHRGYGWYCTQPGMPASKGRLRSQGLPALLLQTTNFPRKKFDEGLPRLGGAEGKPPAGSSAQHAKPKRHYEGAVRGAETLDINVNMFLGLLLARKWACVGGTPGLCHKHIWVHCCTQEPTNLTPLSRASTAHQVSSPCCVWVAVSREGGAMCWGCKYDISELYRSETKQVDISQPTEVIHGGW